MKAINRLHRYIEYKGIKPTRFEKNLGLSNGYLGTQLKRNADLGESILNTIVDNCLDLNPEWLLTGKGLMLKTEAMPNSEETPKVEAMVFEGNKGIYNAIPLVSQYAAAGFGSSDFNIKDSDVKAYYVIPKFKDRRIDFMIEVYGSSMYPKYNSGDVIACTIIKESHFIQWNKVHVLATDEQGLLVKRIKENGNEEILAVSDNPDYPPFRVPKNEITGMALVVGVIRLE